MRCGHPRSHGRVCIAGGQRRAWLHLQRVPLCSVPGPCLWSKLTKMVFLFFPVGLKSLRAPSSLPAPRLIDLHSFSEWGSDYSLKDRLSHSAGRWTAYEEGQRHDGPSLPVLKGPVGMRAVLLVEGRQVPGWERASGSHGRVNAMVLAK